MVRRWELGGRLGLRVGLRVLRPRGWRVGRLVALSFLVGLGVLRLRGLLVEESLSLLGLGVLRFRGLLVREGEGPFGPLILAFILADSFLLATVATIIIVLLLADLGSFRFGDEVIEEKAVLLLFKVEVVDLRMRDEE